MDRSASSSDPPVHAPLPLIALAFLGSAAALLGGWWDDAWHTSRGRDEFFIPPHIAIYAGIAVAGAALAFWALLAIRRGGLRATLAHRPLMLALLSVAVTLASGPIDNFWHVAFGRDAVIWSAPHMLGIAGTLALAASLLAELAGRDERWAPALSLIAGALVLTPAAFAVAEYETDVPQFDELWYLPVLGFASAIAFSLIRSASELRWAATISAAIYTLFIALVSLALLPLGFPGPALPLLVLPALVVDLTHRRGTPALLGGALFSVVLFLAYVPVRNWLGDGVMISAGDIAIGLPLTWLATSLVFALVAGRRPSAASPAAVAATGAVLVALVLSPGALAHDPGQGAPAGSADLELSVTNGRASLVGKLDPQTCAETRARALIARRAGRVVRAPLTRNGCRFEGEIALPTRGRWFVYAEMERAGRSVETWLPITVGPAAERVVEADRYAYFPPPERGGALETLAAIVLYLGMFALLYAALRLIGTARRERSARAAGP